MTNTVHKRIAVDIGVLVADISTSRRFYHELLALPIVAEVTTSLIGKGHMVQLQHGASLIKLVQLDETPPAQDAGSIASCTGYRYITLMVTDISTIMTRLKQANVPIVQPITELGNGAVISMVADPDGNVVEFVQEA